MSDDTPLEEVVTTAKRIQYPTYGNFGDPDARLTQDGSGSAGIGGGGVELPTGGELTSELGGPECGSGTVRVVVIRDGGPGQDMGCYSIPSNYQSGIDYSTKEPIFYGTPEDTYEIIYGPLEEGQYYDTQDINGDGSEEVFKATTGNDGTEQIITVYGFDNEGNKTETEFNEWQYDSFLNELDNVETDQDFVNVLNRYTEAGLENNSVVASLAAGGPAKTPEDIFKDMMEERGVPGAVIVDVDGVLRSDGTIRGFFENVDVLIRGIFKLPIPDWLPLPAIFKLPSVVDIWDNTVGKVLEGVDEGCFGEGEASVSDCTGQILSGIGDAVSDATNTVIGKVQEAYEGVVGAIEDPEDAVQQVYDWLKGIWGEDPTSMPPWIWGVIGAGVLGPKILGGLEGIFGSDVDGDGNVGEPPVPPVYSPENPNPDCISAGAVTDENGNCVCPEGSEYVEASKSCEPTGPVVNEVEEDCKQKGREYNEVTNSCGDCKLDTHQPDEITGECVEVTPTTSGTDDGIDCSKPQPGYTPSFSGYAGSDADLWEKKCGQTHCPDGSLKPESGVCGEQTQTQPCPNGATVESDCTQCPDGSAPSSHEEGNCNNPLTSITPNTTLSFSPNCDEPRPTGPVTFELIEQQKAWDLECGGGFTGGGSFECLQQNRVTNEDGSCGECLPGYEFDTNFDQCIKKEDPPVTTPTPTPTSDGGGGGGGGGGGVSTPFTRGISYTPQPVPEILPPSGLFTGAQPTQNTQKLGQSVVESMFPEFSSRFLS